LITHIGQRVQLRYAPEHKGTVAKVREGNDFLVVFDHHYRKRREERYRYTYDWSARDSFVPESHEEIRVLESDGEGLGLHISDTLRKLIFE
jgi:hypothetical protein